MKKQAAPAQSGPDAGPWINLGNGRSRSASTGRMRYDPSADPEYQQAIKRIQGQEQAAAAKRALDALGAAASAVSSLGSAGGECAEAARSRGSVIWQCTDDPLPLNYGCNPIMPIQPDQSELTWGQPTRVWPPEQPAPDPGWFTDGITTKESAYELAGQVTWATHCLFEKENATEVVVPATSDYGVVLASQSQRHLGVFELVRFGGNWILQQVKS